MINQSLHKSAKRKIVTHAPVGVLRSELLMHPAGGMPNVEYLLIDIMSQNKHWFYEHFLRLGS